MLLDTNETKSNNINEHKVNKTPRKVYLKRNYKAVPTMINISNGKPFDAFGKRTPRGRL